jgi:hypothetical protein
MTLRQEQSLFAKDIIKLLTWATSQGYDVTFGEAQRSVEQQALYVKYGRSKTMNSYHIKRLAFDLFFFSSSGKLLSSKEEMQPIGDYWESLSPMNSWGGNWNSFKDVPHFERRYLG